MRQGILIARHHQFAAHFVELGRVPCLRGHLAGPGAYGRHELRDDQGNGEHRGEGDEVVPVDHREAEARREEAEFEQRDVGNRRDGRSGAADREPRDSRAQHVHHDDVGRGEQRPQQEG